MQVRRKEEAEALLSVFGEVGEVDVHPLFFSIVMEVLYLNFKYFAVSEKTIK